MPTPMIAIDPGMSGGIAWIAADGHVECEKMPDTMPEQCDMLRSIASENRGVTATMERTGTYRPGESATAAVKFARHCGNIEAVLYALGIPAAQVAPTVWQSALGSLPADKKARKNAIKDAMQRKHPHLKVTLATSDALGILAWASSQIKP